MSPHADSALEGVRVLELTEDMGAYCGKLLADLGADVIKVEPPGGDRSRLIPPFLGKQPDPERSLSFLYNNTSKRSVTLDLEDSVARERFRELARTTDLVIEGYPPGHLDALDLGYAELSKLNPGIVLTSISGFGQTGPQRGFRWADIVAGALGGAMICTGDAEDPPVQLASSQAEVLTATCAAAGSLIALRHSRLTGQGQHVDVSSLETVVAATHICGVGKWLEDGIIPKRAGTGLTASVPSGAFPCKDGYVYLMVNRAKHWEALAEWIHEVTGNEEVLDPMFHGPSSIRLPYCELLDLFISDMTCQLTVQEAYHEGQRRHIAFTPVNTAASVANDGHLAAREFFVDLEIEGAETLRFPGAPYKHDLTPWQIHRPTPRVGEHNREILEASAAAAKRPRRETGKRSTNSTSALEGLRVVEFGTGMAAPWISRFMAWCGAEVIKVESEQYPDVPRLYISPREPEKGLQNQCSPWFTDWNAGKRFIGLDLTRPDAAELCRDVIAKSDIVVANYSTGVLEKLGLGYDTLKVRNPELILLSSNGYGDSGPQRRYVTWGPNIEALSGLSSLTGFPDRDCTMTHFAYPDPLSALHGLVAVMAALEYREREGRGQYINMSQFETTVASIGPVLLEYLANGEEPTKLGNRSHHAAPHGCYPCSGEDRWCVLSVESDLEWQRFCEVLGRPAWTQDPRFATPQLRIEHAEALDTYVGEWSSKQTDYDVMAAMQGVGIACGVVQNTEDLLRRDPQLAARGFFEEIPHYKRGVVTASGIPLGLTGTPGRTAHAGEAIGQDNEYVFREILGLSAAQLQEHIASGAIETG
jgi:crotonobetainyl-CoA:carnitine CoA-transferase CaiB-like acyl-CoA transferase